MSLLAASILFLTGAAVVTGQLGERNEERDCCSNLSEQYYATTRPLGLSTASHKTLFFLAAMSQISFEPGLGTYQSLGTEHLCGTFCVLLLF